MLDTLIKGAVIHDGNGGPARSGDIAIADGVIVGVGDDVAGAARQVIDADGAIVTPGFIDPHSHYDGQLLWDDMLDPSFSHGVTTVVAGNCGVGFAPLDHRFREQMIELMEGVEDIPGIVLDKGLDWQWTSFPEYLDRIAARRYTMDVGVKMTHAPLRVFVMGERALAHEAATADDIAEMSRLVREGMAAGALGFSTGQAREHKSSRGEAVPGTFSTPEELIALGRAMGQSQAGVYQLVPKGDGGDLSQIPPSAEERLDIHRTFEAIARESGRPVTYLLHQIRNDLNDWRMMIGASEQAAAKGLRIHPEIGARGTGFITALDAWHMFELRPSYAEIAHLPLAQRVKAMRQPDRRARILAEDNVTPNAPNAYRIEWVVGMMTEAVDEMYPLGLSPDYEPDPSTSFGAQGRQRGVPAAELLYDYLTEGDGCNLAIRYMLNYWEGHLDAVHDMLAHPLTVSGLADGGAHLKSICDGSLPTFHLSFWARDRSRGATLPVERMIAKLTSEVADLYGMADRGRIAPGLRADLDVIDLPRLDALRPHIVDDLPEGGKRFLQKSQGYVATLVNGVATRLNDCETGARPGRLVRGSGR